LHPLEKYTLVVCCFEKFICIFEFFQELTTSVRAAHAGRTQTLSKNAGCSKFQTVRPASTFSGGYGRGSTIPHFR
jgi:hypothetical protein